MAEPLTQLERRVYHYMIDFLAANTYQPSIREIARKFRIKSTKTVSDLLHSLEHKGYIERDESRSRGVRLLGFASSGATQPIPCYARVQAGTPALAPEHRDGFVTMDRRFLPSEAVFMLRVRGSSMSGRGILDGDYVLVDPAGEAKAGDIVAARLGEETLIKILARREPTVRLESASGDDALEISSHEDFSLLGTICGVFRPFWDQPEAARPLLADDDVPAAPTTPGHAAEVTAAS